MYFIKICEANFYKIHRLPPSPFFRAAKPPNL
jgi:hypothetical protein